MGDVAYCQKYREGQGVISAPKGSQSLIEPVITLCVMKWQNPNLGSSYMKYLPFPADDLLLYFNKYYWIDSGLGQCYR